MKLPRTPAEIVARAQEAMKRDMLGFEWQEYVLGLTFKDAAPLCKEGATGDGWPEPLTVEQLSEQAKGYLPFWLEKIENERGISVCRATQHFTAWKWLLGHPDADTFPGSINGPDGGWYQRTAYEYVRTQIDSGEWDRMTEGVR